MSEDLSSELTSVKAFYERALEQLSQAENEKKLHHQHMVLTEQEKQHLQSEVDRLTRVFFCFVILARGLKWVVGEFVYYSFNQK